MIKAIFFDMDGVLIDAKEWHYEALNKALAHFGININLYEHLSTYDGLPTKKKLQMLNLTKGLSPKLFDFLNDLKQIYTMQIVHSSCKPNFIHEYALSKLKNEGYKMAVCSNSIKNTVDVMMQKAALENYLDFKISNEDVTKAKPDPQMYLLAMQKLNLKPHECMICEDNENGIKAAKASGANVMIIDTPSDVNYENIKKHINLFEKRKSK
ncbi:HAD family phosphatase [Campylobacter sp. RM12640]|uniref:HAD family hydrolase n=1 Tax=unclassified Campylobacter TaxID=2593542 RepID=UPI003014C192|nr:HAD family phosphatase [Campylobacter sp. RM12640]MBZ7990024.1 HAD family phosphatase [Campylobacter sp. RM12635]